MSESASTAEVEAIKGVALALEPITSEARVRVLHWALQFHASEAKKEAIEVKKQLDELRKTIRGIDEEEAA